MKAYKIVIFIFSVIALLAIISLVFPSDGMKAGTINFEFPSLMSIIGTPEEESVEEPVLSPEELLEQRLNALKAAKDDEFMAFCTNDPTRFFLPDSDISYFDGFFEALDDAKSKKVRIVHYGDSQIEEDRMTGYLRERFQSAFGGSGVGMLPAVPKSVTHTVSQHISPEETHYYLAYGAGERSGNRRYGPMAQIARVTSGTNISFRTREPENFPHCQKFSEVKVLMQGSGSFTVNTGNEKIDLVCDSTKTFGETKIYTASLPIPVNSCSLSITGSMNIMSIQLDGKTGVVMDNVPMRGCSGTMFTNIDRQTLEAFYSTENVGLIILQYGGNAVPYLKGAESISRFAGETKRQIELFHRLAPKAKILYIGPSDMSTSINGNMQTYPMLPEVVKALRQAANEAGAAYWDMFTAMGGKGSMVQWVHSRPQLAGEDYIHFTPKGAMKVSEILYDTFDTYYRYYRFRTGKDVVKIEPDSTVTVTDSVSISAKGLDNIKAKE